MAGSLLNIISPTRTNKPKEIAITIIERQTTIEIIIKTTLTTVSTIAGKSSTSLSPLMERRIIRT